MKKTISILLVLLIGYLLCMNFLVVPYYPNQSIYIIKPLLWLALAVFTYIFTKDKYVKVKDKNKVLQICIIIVMSYTIIYYLSGLYFGFIKTAYSRSLFSIIKNIYAFVLIIIAEEYVRYRILTYGKKNIILFIFVSLTFVLVEFNFSTLFSQLKTNAAIFEFVSSQLLPLICCNLFYSYLVMVNNYKASISFRVPVLLLSLIIGIFPDLNWYIYGCVQIIYTAISYYIIRYYLKKKNNDKEEAHKYATKNSRLYEYISWIGFILILMTLVMFISGNFKYVPIAIMSNSMDPIFERGDVLIYKKVTDFDNLKPGNILVFVNDNK
ncbi:MAG: hypothetical protein RSE91_04255, partial [Bacilli bacterium]